MPIAEKNGTSLYCEEYGSGFPLLLIAGLGCDVLSWGGILETLARRFRVVMFDNRGVGRSPTPAQGYSTDDMVGDCLSVMDHFGIERAHVMGHSMGGWIAQRLAAAHPHRVERLVLYSTTFQLPSPILRFIGSLVHLRRTHPDTAVETMFRLFMPWLYSPRFLADDARVQSLIFMARAHPYPQSAEGFSYQVDICSGSDDSSHLPRIQAPTLVLAGTSDITIPCEFGRQLAEGISGARFVTMEGGHNLHLEDAAAFLGEVRAFLEEGLAADG